MYSIFVYLPITIILAISTYTDINKRLIYDKVTIPGMMYFFLYHLLVNTSSWASWGSGFLILGGVSLIIAAATNSLGGGDIKLFAVIGLAYGIDIGFQIYFYTYACAVLFSVPLLIRNKFFTTKPKINSIPMAPFMTMGTILVYLFN